MLTRKELIRASHRGLIEAQRSLFDAMDMANRYGAETVLQRQEIRALTAAVLAAETATAGATDEIADLRALIDALTKANADHLTTIRELRATTAELQSEFFTKDPS